MGVCLKPLLGRIVINLLLSVQKFNATLIDNGELVCATNRSIIYGGAFSPIWDLGCQTNYNGTFGMIWTETSRGAVEAENSAVNFSYSLPSSSFEGTF